MLLFYISLNNIIWCGSHCGLLIDRILLEQKGDYELEQKKRPADFHLKFDHSNKKVTKNTDCPAVLVELAFISNLEDEKILASAKGKTMFAAAIARGCTDMVAAGA